MEMEASEKAKKELEIISWMTKQGYDRKASQEIAPIILQYNLSIKQTPLKDQVPTNITSIYETYSLEKLVELEGQMENELEALTDSLGRVQTEIYKRKSNNK